MVAKNLNRSFEYGSARQGGVTPAAHYSHWFEPEQRVGPAFGVLVEHLRRDSEDGDVETIFEERLQLGHAVHGVLDDHDVGSGFRIGVRDVTTRGEFEDVGDPYPVCVRSLLHSVGQIEQFPCVAEEVFAPRREDDMTAIAHKESCAELILELADLFGECGLADMELVGSPAEVKLIGHRYEVAHEAQVEVHAYP
jgi:hypothetical protein